MFGGTECRTCVCETLAFVSGGSVLQVEYLNLSFAEHMLSTASNSHGCVKKTCFVTEIKLLSESLGKHELPAADEDTQFSCQ